jgi:hypothetical protein
MECRVISAGGETNKERARRVHPRGKLCCSKYGAMTWKASSLFTMNKHEAGFTLHG